MTESKWLQCDHPDQMLDFLGPRAGDRKLLLFACACCRRIAHLLECEQAVHALDVHERYVCGQGSMDECLIVSKAIDSARLAALITPGRPLAQGVAWDALWKALSTCQGSSDYLFHDVLEERDHAENLYLLRQWEAIVDVARHAVVASAWEADYPDWWDYHESSLYFPERAAQAVLVREVFGNPFEPPQALAYWPRVVVTLAKALDGGDDCDFALHDALLEAGQSQLAAHFQDRKHWHPKGCWALDLILGMK